MTDPRVTYGQRWTEREYLIVLQGYLEHKGEPQHADSFFVREIARLLGRTPHSILYRLQNFASVDPDEKDPRRKGKAHITDMGRRIFLKWSAKRESLKDTADAFVRDEKTRKEQDDLFSPSPVRLPTTFRQYELLDEIGRGGFGFVYSCLDVESQEPYALKVIDCAKMHNSECVHRFGREIRALKALDHPNVIRIHADNLDDEKSYPGFVMDLAECDLAGYLGERARESGDQNSRPLLAKDEGLGIFLSVLNGVEALHQLSPPVIHRDINPKNILRMFDGSWVLADFSLAKFLPPLQVSTSFATETWVAMGTGHYASPEQFRSLTETSVRSDIYSLGWLLWELLTSEGPFPRSDPSGLPEELETIFLKATNYKPEARYNSVADMRHDLEKIC